MKRAISKLYTFLLLLLCGLPALAGDSGQKEVEALAKKLMNLPGLTANFILKSQQGTETGVLTMSGKRFMIDANGMKIWFDGKTQWTYVPNRKEVTVIEPTIEELGQVNPYMILSNLTGKYSVKKTGTPSSLKKFFELDAIARNTEPRKIVIETDARNFPVSMIMTLRDGSTVSLGVSNLKELSKTPDSSNFRFQKKMAPGAEIVDLR